MALIPQRWLIFLAPLILALIVAALMLDSAAVNDGHLLFALDDPYIHLSMARNLVDTGVWGINAGEFSSTSSAPLYTLLLAGFLTLSGPTELWAWGATILGTILVVLLLGHRAHTSGFQGRGTVLAGLYFIVIIGLAEFALLGMEHTLHMCAVIGVLWAMERALDPAHRTKTRACALVLLVLLAAGLRYETLFLIPPVALTLWFARRRALAVAVTLVALIPATTLGLVQVANGASFLPNTIIVKALNAAPGPLDYIDRFLTQVSSARWTALIVYAGAALWIGLRRGKKWDSPRVYGPAMLAFTIGAHCAFAVDNARYVGYLVALGAWVLLPHVREWMTVLRGAAEGRGQRIIAAGLIIAALVLPFAGQIENLSTLPKYGHDIYLQQYQMAEFVNTYYPGRPVALNDIGLIAWRGRNRVLDLWGLANDRITKWRHEGEYNSQRIAEVTAEYQAPIAIIYPGWFSFFGGVPPDWYRVGHWQIPLDMRTTVGSHVIFFYAASESEARTLLANLKQFESRLPNQVEASY